MLPLAELCASAMDAPMLTFYSFWSACSGVSSSVSPSFIQGHDTSTVEQMIISSNFTTTYLQHVLSLHDPVMISGLTSLL